LFFSQCPRVGSVCRFRFYSSSLLLNPYSPPEHANIGHLSVLVETNVLGLLTEALTAEVEVVLADQTGLVLANTAAASALAVGSGARVPDAFVRHDCGIVVSCR